MFMLYLNLAIRTNDLYPTTDLSFYHQFPVTHFFFVCLFVLFICLALTLSLWFSVFQPRIEPGP